MEAFNNLSESLRKISSMIQKQEKRVRSHKRRAQYLTIVYMRFLVLFLAALANQPSSLILQCKHWWLPFAVCLFISIIYFMAFLDAVISFYCIQNELDISYLYENLLYNRIQEAETLQWIEEQPSSSDYQVTVSPDPAQLLKRKFYICFTILVMFALTASVLYACRLLWCMHAGNSYINLLSLNCSIFVLISIYGLRKSLMA